MVHSLKIQKPKIIQTPSQEIREKYPRMEKCRRQKIKGDQLDFLSVLLVLGGGMCTVGFMLQILCVDFSVSIVYVDTYQVFGR